MAVAFFPLPAAATLVVDSARRKLCIVIFRIFLQALYLMQKEKMCRKLNKIVNIFRNINFYILKSYN